MSRSAYTASKSQSNRPGWSISFRHPLRRDARGRIGLKMRRGLGTTDENEAQKMVDEMNHILEDQSWWNAARRPEAEARFSKAVVEAFFDEIQAGGENLEGLREACIHLPSASDEYTRVLFVGTTGAGKTSLLRQLIGSDPDRDRFPSTAPAKTTISDIEVVLAEGRYEAVVTFFTAFQIQANIEECIVDACLSSMQRDSDDMITNKFLNHRDQRFRLSYILGNLREDSGDVSGESFSFDPEEEAPEDDDGIPESEAIRNSQAIKAYLKRIKTLSDETAGRIKTELGVDSGHVSPQDRAAASELIEENFESYLVQNESFHELVQDVMEDVRSRFEHIPQETLSVRSSGWPDVWTFQSENRDEFIRQIRWFSSNYWRQFGRLLTPLVEGIRVKGPFCPDHYGSVPKLALIDGQGLGHTPDSASSVTTHITSKFSKSNVILLVDNAQQPMQAAPLSVLRAVATSGHYAKLSIAFTHFDQIKGKNLRSFADKRAHVMASVSQAISNMADTVGASVAKAMSQGLDDRCFMLGGLDKQFGQLPESARSYMQTQIDEMISFFESSIEPPEPIEALPIYDPTGINFALQKAVDTFHGPWEARLGLDVYEGVRKEHWTRVKALNRRLANELDIEYDSLRPVADLVARITEAMSRFLDNPIEWTRTPADEHEEQLAIAQIKQEASEGILTLAKKRLAEDNLSNWRTAYDYRGGGSTVRRAEMIDHILGCAAPKLDATLNVSARGFLKGIRGIMVESIETVGGKIDLEETAS
ncbi:MAG: GTPase domain-containing protein [Humidesulfovibrio sp.]